MFIDNCVYLIVQKINSTSQSSGYLANLQKNATFSDKRGCFMCQYFVCPNSLVQSNIWWNVKHQTKQHIIQKTEGNTGIFQWNNISFFNSSNIFWESITQCKVMNPFQTFKNKIRQRVIDVNNAHKSFYL